MNTTAKHTPDLAADGWTLIYRDAKQAAYAHEAVKQGADEDCVGPGKEGWYWYNEGTGQIGGRLNLALIAAAPELLEALDSLLSLGVAEQFGNWEEWEEVKSARAAIAKATGHA